MYQVPFTFSCLEPQNFPWGITFGYILSFPLLYVQREELRAPNYQITIGKKKEKRKPEMTSELCQVEFLVDYSKFIVMMTKQTQKKIKKVPFRG